MKQEPAEAPVSEHAVSEPAEGELPPPAGPSPTPETEGPAVKQEQLEGGSAVEAPLAPGPAPAGPGAGDAEVEDDLPDFTPPHSPTQVSSEAGAAAPPLPEGEGEAAASPSAGGGEAGAAEQALPAALESATPSPGAPAGPAGPAPSTPSL